MTVIVSKPYTRRFTTVNLGMQFPTSSRSFVSFPRHVTFKRTPTTNVPYKDVEPHYTTAGEVEKAREVSEQAGWIAY